LEDHAHKRAIPAAVLGKCSLSSLSDSRTARLRPERQSCGESRTTTRNKRACSGLRAGTDCDGPCNGPVAHVRVLVKFPLAFRQCSRLGRRKRWLQHEDAR
jgi:hypothetical protein